MSACDDDSDAEKNDEDDAKNSKFRQSVDVRLAVQIRVHSNSDSPERVVDHSEHVLTDEGPLVEDKGLVFGARRQGQKRRILD